ncbi:MAG: HEPN domain-containing protein, partial [Alphaproteobacteria bacterium]|nr:HEPN domain-containing protein [Alphaproteobacteria bacterium]
ASILERESLGFPGRDRVNAAERCLRVIEKEIDTDEWLSLVELCCHLLAQMRDQGHDYAQHNYAAEQTAEDALQEINDRFRENGFGYQFENGEIIRIDDQYVHAEIVRPALQFLSGKGFEKANEEFMTAHRHYRAGEFKDAIVAANRAYEATLKAICDTRGWKYEKGARASDLVTLVRKSGLFPDYLDEGLNTYVAMMKTGLPGLRNNAGGHGESSKAPKVPSYLAAHAIHLTAANILLLIEAHKNKR